MRQPPRRVRSTILAIGLSTVATLTVAATASAAERIVMATTGVASAQQWPIWIANAKGYFAEAGVTMDFVAAPSASAVIQQVTAGSADLGSGGLSDPIRAIDRGARISLLRIEAQVPPYSIWGRKTLTSLKELKGRTVMLGGIKDITRIYFERMIVPNGMKPGDYDSVYAGTASSRFAALVSGAVDATILNPPFSFKAEAAGFARLGNVTDYVKNLPFTGYAVNVAWGHAHKPAISGFLQAVTRGVDWFYADANRDEAIEILRKLANAERGDIAQAYDYYRQLRMFDRKGLVDGSEIGNLIAALAEIGDLEGPAVVARFLDPEIAALARKVE